MIFCLAVHLAHDANRVVSDFCETDASDLFWMGPSESPDTDDSAGAENSSFAEGIEAHRVVWFRSRRITLLAGRA